MRILWRWWSRIHIGEFHMRISYMRILWRWWSRIWSGLHMYVVQTNSELTQILSLNLSWFLSGTDQSQPNRCSHLLALFAVFDDFKKWTVRTFRTIWTVNTVREIRTVRFVRCSLTFVRCSLDPGTDPCSNWEPNLTPI